MIIVIENINDNDIGNTAINASRLESTFSVCDIIFFSTANDIQDAWRCLAMGKRAVCVEVQMI